VRDKLADDIDAAVKNVAQRMGVVRRNIMLLSVRRTEPLPGLEEKLVDLDVCRHLFFADRLGVSERRIAAEHPL
jgi:hypothetical protein